MEVYGNCIESYWILQNSIGILRDCIEFYGILSDFYGIQQDSRGSYRILQDSIELYRILNRMLYGFYIDFCRILDRILDRVPYRIIDLFIEFYSEEIPSRMQESSSKSLKEGLFKALNENRFSFGVSKEYFGPKRISINIKKKLIFSLIMIKMN